MISAGILGIGMVALIQLHTGSIRSLKRSRDVTVAYNIADQAAEELSLIPLDNTPGTAELPNCPTNQGCRTDPVTFSAAKAAGCTFWVSETGNMRSQAGAYPYSASTTPASSYPPPAEGAGRRFRMDRVIVPHPDPEIGADTSIIDIFVCWTDEAGQVREIRTTRLHGRS